MEKFLQAALSIWNPIGVVRRRPREKTLPVSAVLLSAIALLLFAAPSVALASPSEPTGSVPPSALSEAETTVKMIGEALTAVATLVGLPIVLLSYRKTRVEIDKIELETRALRGAQVAPVSVESETSGVPFFTLPAHSNLPLSAEPRFVAALLIFLDFIVAWIIVDLAGQVISGLTFAAFASPGVAILAWLLFVPIARQAFRLRTLLQPPRTIEEHRASQRQLRVAFYALYATVPVSAVVLGSIIVFESDSRAGQYFGGGLVAVCVMLIACFRFASRRFDRYLLEGAPADRP